MMRTFSLAEAADWLGASTTAPDVRFRNVSTDTRSINAGDLFVALRGEHFNGHLFVQGAEKAGAVAAVVDEPVIDAALPQLQVSDTTSALARLAQGNRLESAAHCVAITGSSGKTTVKEMVAAILQGAGETLATQGNLNNHIGVPLTLFRLAPEHRYAVIELGASGLGEIAHTVAITRPDVAVLTNAAEAHLEGFGSYNNVVLAKGEIIDGVAESGVVVLNRDDPAFAQWQQRAGHRRVRTASRVPGVAADYCCEMLASRGAEQRLRVSGPEQWSCEVSLSLLGEHNITNALLAIAAVRELGIGDDLIKSGLSAVQPVAGRLQPITLSPDVVLIDDSYNANPASMKAALGVLAQRSGTRIAVLGAMAELGADAERLHQDVGATAHRLGIERMLTVGAGCEGYQQGFGNSAEICGDHGDAVDCLMRQLAAPVTVLVKGSRSSAMNLVVEGLKNKVTRSCSSG